MAKCAAPAKGKGKKDTPKGVMPWMPPGMNPANAGKMPAKMPKKK
jgi:hypothetical protein